MMALLLYRHQNFAPAKAWIIDKNTVKLTSDIINPFAVRYAWQDNPPSTLYNSFGLPASPFRTDDFTLVTADFR